MNENGSGTVIKAIVARNVRALRRGAGLSQQALADMVAMNRTYLSDIENARGNASVELLVKIADGLDVPVTRLFASPTRSTGRAAIKRQSGLIGAKSFWSS